MDVTIKILNYIPSREKLPTLLATPDMCICMCMCMCIFMSMYICVLTAHA